MELLLKPKPQKRAMEALIGLMPIGNGEKVRSKMVINLQNNDMANIKCIKESI